MNNMANFNSKSFEKKLKSLDPTQTGIQTLSLWILHHRHNAEQITSTWLEQISKSKYNHGCSPLSCLLFFYYFQLQ
jgi:hypothetical protein